MGVRYMENKEWEGLAWNIFGGTVFLLSFVFFVVKKWAVMMLFDAGFDAYFVRKNDKKRAVWKRWNREKR